MTVRAGRAILPAGLLGAALAWAIFPGAAGGAEGKRLHLCNPGGEIRAERTPRGLRVRFVDKSGRPGDMDFTLPGWEVRSASAGGGKACLELGKRAGALRKKRKKARAGRKKSDGVLRAEDEVIEYGGAFQDKVIIRRGRRVIEQGGERSTIREKKIIVPKMKSGPMETAPQ